MSDRGSLFTSKFWLSLCPFLGIKQRLFTAFDPWTDGQTKEQNSTIEVYLWTFVNIKWNNWAKLLPMAEFMYNNAKNASTSHIPFKLNCGYHCNVKARDNPTWLSYSISPHQPCFASFINITSSTSLCLFHQHHPIKLVSTRQHYYQPSSEIRSPTRLCEPLQSRQVAWAQGLQERQSTDQHPSRFNGGGMRGETSIATNESHWRKPQWVVRETVSWT